jgi:hypothetical protein
MGAVSSARIPAIRTVLGGLRISRTELYDLSLLRFWHGRLFILEFQRDIKLNYLGHNILLILVRARCEPIGKIRAKTTPPFLLIHLRRILCPVYFFTLRKRHDFVLASSPRFDQTRSAARSKAGAAQVFKDSCRANTNYVPWARSPRCSTRSHWRQFASHQLAGLARIRSCLPAGGQASTN